MVTHNYTVDKIKKIFFEFMLNKGYRKVEPDSLISKSFPTTFTVSGGPNFVDDFLEEGKFKGNTVVAQHCIRHWDFESVGDGKHLSFFEMAVVSAIDGFSRKKILKDQFDFLTEKLHLNPERFWVTVFGGGEVRGGNFQPDTEVWNIWQELYIPPERIVIIPQDVPIEVKEICNRDKNRELTREAFIANAVEPVGGPRSEIFYDTGNDRDCPNNCIPGLCDCGKYIEIFTTANYTHTVTPINGERDRFGETKLVYKPIKRHSIYAAGFGVERVVQVSNKFDSIEEIDIFAELLDLVYYYKKSFVYNRETEKALSVVVDHLKGIVFLISEGVLQLKGGRNRSRKYEYRRYLRNFFKNVEASIGWNEHLFKVLIKKIIFQYKKWYPKLNSPELTELVLNELMSKWRNYLKNGS